MKLVSIETADVRHAEMLRRMWIQSREEVRRAYWELTDPDFQGDVSELCPLYASVILFPDVWDIFHVRENAYREGARLVYSLQDSGEWIEQSVSLIDSHVL